MTSRLVTLLLLATGCIVILEASRGDLWLDEIWSVGFAEHAQNGVEIFTRFRHDNNHLLNTLLLYLLHQYGLSHWYRAPAVLAGWISLIIVVQTARKWGYVAQLIALILVGSSYPLVLYFSEARGYALAVMFALLSNNFAADSVDSQKRTPLRFAGFWAASILGLLAHFTYIIVLLSQCIAMLSATRSRRQNSESRYQPVLTLFSVPIVFAVALYLTFARNMVIGGGPQQSLWSTICDLATSLFAVPNRLPFSIPALTAFSAAPILGFILFKEKDHYSAAFYPSVLLIVPFATVIVFRPEYIYFRYFVVCIPFFYLLSSRLLAANCNRRNIIHKISVVAATALVVFLQFLKIDLLTRLGRGNYSAALIHVIATSPRSPIMIGSDHDFRNGMLIDYFVQRNKTLNDIHYVSQDKWTSTPLSWFIVHSQDVKFSPPMEIKLPTGQGFALDSIYPYAGVSGWSWFLYRRSDGI